MHVDPDHQGVLLEQLRRGVEDLRSRDACKTCDGRTVVDGQPWKCPGCNKAFGAPASVGRKLDNGKLQWSLFPVNALREISRVLMWGAYEVPLPDGTKGYGPGNWAEVQEARRRYYDAAMRHLTTWYEGEKLDPDSGRSHLAHASCCCLFLLALELRGKLPSPGEK